MKAAQGGDFIEAVFEKLAAHKQEHGEIPRLTKAAQKALLALGHYREQLSNEELLEVIACCAQEQNMHPAVREVFMQKLEQAMKELDPGDEQAGRTMARMLELHQKPTIRIEPPGGDSSAGSSSGSGPDAGGGSPDGGGDPSSDPPTPQGDASELVTGLFQQMYNLDKGLFSLFRRVKFLEYEPWRRRDLTITPAWTSARKFFRDLAQLIENDPDGRKREEYLRELREEIEVRPADFPNGGQGSSSSQERIVRAVKAFARARGHDENQVRTREDGFKLFGIVTPKVALRDLGNEIDGVFAGRPQRDRLAILNSLLEIDVPDRPVSWDEFGPQFREQLDEELRMRGFPQERFREALVRRCELFIRRKLGDRQTSAPPSASRLTGRKLSQDATSWQPVSQISKRAIQDSGGLNYKPFRHIRTELLTPELVEQLQYGEITVREMGCGHGWLFAFLSDSYGVRPEALSLCDKLDVRENLLKELQERFVQYDFLSEDHLPAQLTPVDVLLFPSSIRLKYFWDMKEAEGNLREQGKEQLRIIFRNCLKQLNPDGQIRIDEFINPNSSESLSEKFKAFQEVLNEYEFDSLKLEQPGDPENFRADRAIVIRRIDSADGKGQDPGDRVDETLTHRNQEAQKLLAVVHDSQAAPERRLEAFRALERVGLDTEGTFFCNY